MTYMRAAIELAHLAGTQGEVPVGAVVVMDQRIIASAHNEVMKRGDVTAHAEMLALQQASHAVGERLLDSCDLYVTLEPCPMCAQAISFARIRRLYYGAYDIKGGGVDHGPRLFQQATCFHKPEVYGGIHETECAQLLQRFFLDKR